VTPTTVTSAPLSHDSGRTSAEYPAPVEEEIGHATFDYVLSEHADNFDVDAFIADFEEENGSVGCNLENPSTIDVERVADDDALNIDDVADLLSDFDQDHQQHAHGAAVTLIPSTAAPALPPQHMGRFTPALPPQHMGRFTPALPPQPQVPNVTAFFLHLLQPPNPSQPTAAMSVTPPALMAMPSKKGHKSKARLDSKQWTDRETECLRQGMVLFGARKYKWTLIKKYFSADLKARSNVDLKDRWRNLLGRKQRRNRKQRNGPYSR